MLESKEKEKNHNPFRFNRGRSFDQLERDAYE